MYGRNRILKAEVVAKFIDEETENVLSFQWVVPTKKGIFKAELQISKNSFEICLGILLNSAVGIQLCQVQADC